MYQSIRYSLYFCTRTQHYYIYHNDDYSYIINDIKNTEYILANSKVIRLNTISYNKHLEILKNNYKIRKLYNIPDLLLQPNSMPNLKVLILFEQNNVKISQLKNFKNLITLNCVNGNLILDCCLSQLTTIKKLHITTRLYNDITKFPQIKSIKIIGTFASINLLKILTITTIREIAIFMSETILPNCESLSNIQKLRLSKYTIGINNISKMTNLRYLFADKSDNKNWYFLAGCKKLQTVSLPDNISLYNLLYLQNTTIVLNPYKYTHRKLLS